MFPTNIYTERRKRLTEICGNGLLLFLGNRESPMNFADNSYAFRQDSTFLYFFGLNQPDLAALIDPADGRTIIFGDELTIDHIVWMGDLPTIADRAAKVGVTETRPLADLASLVSEATEQARPVHHLPPYRADHTLQLSELLGLTTSAVSRSASLDLIRAVVDLRNIKQPEEIAEIDKAVDIAVDMHTAAMAMVRPGMREAQIAAEVERIAHASGGRLSFPVIATINGQILHNHDHCNVVQEGQMFLLDAGAETELGYASDLSSTFPVSPRFTEQQRIMVDLSLAAHQAAVDTLAPGIPNRDVHFAAARVIATGMKDLGIMKGDTDEALAAGAHAMFFPCGVGHMMGLDVHDMENLGESHVGYAGKPKSTQFGLKSLRLARPLEPGFVITVEPGIYFIPQLMDLWRKEGTCADFLNFKELNKWRDFGGIRNEEDYLITANGKRRLGTKVKPMTVAEVEAIRNG